MNQLDVAGRSELHYAALANDVQAAQRELAAGTDPRLADKLGMTPLHLAAQDGAVDVAKVLLSRGALVDAVDQWGNSPLFRAVFNYRGEPSMILLLRGAGADVDLLNNHGVSPRSLAKSIANYNVAKWLEDDGPGERQSRAQC